MIITVIAFAGCTSVNVKKVDSNEHLSLVCIEKNPSVLVRDFLTVVENGFIRHGIETEIYTGNTPPHCNYILTYDAGRGWDLAPFLNYAELYLKHGNKIIAKATYKHSGGLALNKWASTESKMMPVIEQLLTDFKKPMSSLTVDTKTVPVALMINQDNISKNKIELSERWEKAGTTLNGLQLFIDNNTKSKPSEDIVRVWVKTIANTDNSTDLLEIDCVQLKIKKIDNQKESLAFAEQTNEWKLIVPETASELIFNSVCLKK